MRQHHITQDFCLITRARNSYKIIILAIYFLGNAFAHFSNCPSTWPCVLGPAAWDPGRSAMAGDIGMGDVPRNSMKSPLARKWPGKPNLHNSTIRV